MSNVIVNGIVLSSMPMGEYDRRLEILTGSCGRISAFAPGARKPSSDLVSVSRVFAFGSFELYQGKSSYSVRSARIADYFTELSENIDLTYYGFYFLELARYYSRENVESSEMLKLVYYSLKALTRDSLDNRLVRSIYELKMLDLNGVCPDADKITASDGRFSIGRELNQSASYAIYYVINASVEKLYTFKLSDEVRAEFTEVVDHLMALTVDKKFRSLEFLELLP